MATYTIYEDVEYNIIVEADSAEEAYRQAIKTPRDQWDASYYDERYTIHDEDGNEPSYNDPWGGI